MGTANVSANLDVVTQGVTLCEANVTGTGAAIGSLFVIRTLEAQSIGQATSQSEIILSKLLSASVIGLGVSEGNINLALKVDGNIEAKATTEANIQRVISLSSSIDTSVTTSAEAQITRVLNAEATATANTDASAQLTIPVNAEATATANTSADAQLTYSVNATATAIAETTSEAQITRIISAEATATANSSADANFGITFNAGIEATANVVNADLFRAATMQGSLTGQATLVNALITTVDNVAASLTGAATVTNATLNVVQVDPNFANVSLLLHGNGTNGSTVFTDNSQNNYTATRFGNTVISTAQSKFGGASILFDGNADYLNYPDVTNFDLPNDFTIETFVYFTAYSASYNGEFGAAIVANYIASQGINYGWQLRVNGTSNSYTTINVYTGLTDLNFSAGNIALNTWHYIAVTRSGTSIRAYVNGSQVGSTVSNSDNFTHNKIISRPLFIGGLNDPSYKFWMNGYIDEMRITKGVARYTGATLTVPTSQFPDQ
jgi:hypothetical protein